MYGEESTILWNITIPAKNTAKMSKFKIREDGNLPTFTIADVVNSTSGEIVADIGADTGDIHQAMVGKLFNIQACIHILVIRGFPIKQ